MRSIFARRSATISSGVIARVAGARRRDAGAPSCAAAAPSSSTSAGVGRVVDRPWGWRARPSRLEFARPPRRPRRASPARFRRRTTRGASGRIRRSRARRRARAASARTRLERRAGPRGYAPPVRRTRRAATATLRRPSARDRAARRTCADPRRASLRTRQSTRRSARAGATRLRCRSSRRVVIRVSSSRAASSSRCTSSASALVRSTSAGVRRLGFGRCAPPAPASPRAPRTAGAAPRSAARRPSRCSASMRAIDCLRLFLPRVLRAQLLFGRAALGRDLILLAADALGGLARRSPPAGRSRQSTFSWRCSSPCSDSNRRLGGRDRRRRATRSRSRSRSTAALLCLGALAQLLDLALASSGCRAPRRACRLRRRARRGRPRRRASRLGVLDVSAARRADSKSRAIHACESAAARIASAGRAADPHDLEQRREVRRRLQRRAIDVDGAIGDEEPDAAGIVRSRANCRPAAACLVRLHDDVLQQIAEAGFDRALVSACPPRGSRRPSPSARRRRRIRRGPGGRRRRTRRGPRRAPRATSAAPCTPARSRSRARSSASRASRSARAPASSDSRAARSRRSASIASCAASHGALPRARDPRSRAPLRRRGRGSRRRAWPSCSPIRARAAAACSIAWRSAVAALTAANTSLRAASTSASSPSMFRCSVRVRGLLAAQRLGGLRRARRRARAAASRRAVELEPRRLAARLERPDLGLDIRRRQRQATRPAACRTRSAAAAGRSPARCACAASRAAVVRLSASVSSRRSRSSVVSTSATCAAAAVSRARASASRARAASIASPSTPIALRELHLLPAPQLFAQPLVAPRLRGLPLQRAALLLDLEDDVVDARQVLLRGLELQLRGAAAALVLRHAGRFLDQLAPIGRPRAQDLADLALLDDGVGLDAEARVHQQVLHVAQPDRSRRRSGIRSRPSGTAGASARRRAR